MSCDPENISDYTKGMEELCKYTSLANVESEEAKKIDAKIKNMISFKKPVLQALMNETKEIQMKINELESVSRQLVEENKKLTSIYESELKLLCELQELLRKEEAELARGTNLLKELQTIRKTNQFDTDLMNDAWERLEACKNFSHIVWSASSLVTDSLDGIFCNPETHCLKPFSFSKNDKAVQDKLWSIIRNGLLEENSQAAICNDIFQSLVISDD